MLNRRGFLKRAALALMTVPLAPLLGEAAKPADAACAHCAGDDAADDPGPCVTGQAAPLPYAKRDRVLDADEAAELDEMLATPTVAIGTVTVTGNTSALLNGVANGTNMSGFTLVGWNAPFSDYTYSVTHNAIDRCESNSFWVYPAWQDTEPQP